MLLNPETMVKSQILEKIPLDYCVQVLKTLNVRNNPPELPGAHHDITRILAQKITREEAVYLYRKWESGLFPRHAARGLKKPDGTTLSVLVSMNLRERGFYVETEVLLNNRYCDVVAFKGGKRLRRFGHLS